MRKFSDLTDEEKKLVLAYGVAGDDCTPSHANRELTPSVGRTDAILQIIENMEPDKPLKELCQETIEVAGYVPMKVDRSRLSPLNDLIERLDESYCHEDCDIGGDLTAKMIEAEKLFLDAVLAEYRVSLYDEICIDDIHIGEFVKCNSANWLNETESDLTA